MTSLLYPHVNQTTKSQLSTQWLNTQRFTNNMFKTQWQMLLSRTEERINNLRLIDGLSLFQTTLLRSGLDLLGLELELVMPEDYAGAVPDVVGQQWGSTGKGYSKYILVEIEKVEEAVYQCCQSKLLTKNEAFILLFGLRLLKVELDELRSIHCCGV